MLNPYQVENVIRLKAEVVIKNFLWISAVSDLFPSFSDQLIGFLSSHFVPTHKYLLKCFHYFLQGLQGLMMVT